MAKDNSLRQSYELEKKQVEDLVGFRKELEERAEQEIGDIRSKSSKKTADAYSDAYLSAMTAAEEKTAAVRANLAKQSAEQAASVTLKSQEKQNKLKAALKKAEDSGDASKAKKLEERLKKETDAQANKLKALDEQFKKESENAEALAALQQKQEERNEKASKYGKIGDAYAKLKNAAENGTLLSTMTSALADFATSLKSTISDISSYKSSIDTRLQGSKNATNYAGSYWEAMSKDISGAAAISPLVKQSDIAAQVKSMVSSGIAYNVEQRAFLYAISDKIASTFETTNSSLNQLVRIQQQDSTAARLGMESALNSFLNNMYETTEYMSEVMSGIRSSLYEAEALMSTEAAAEFDYQVNKWLGSLYSVGMSSEAVQSIGSALGQLASGQISGITSDGAGNLIVMAASNAGLNVAEMLQEGLDDSSTNKLMTSMVQYLKGIYEDTSDSLVVAQQYASVFGLTASDLKALANLSASDVYNTAKNGLSYSGMLTQLNNMANSMYSRVSQGELLENAMNNFKYTLSNGIASSPVLYSMYMLGDVLDAAAGGLPFSLPTVMGTGMAAQTFKTSDIIKTTTLAGSLISGIAGLISSGGNGGITGSGLLNAFGVGSSSTVSRGTGSGLISAGGATVSSSGYVGNASAGDVYNKSMADTQDSANAQTVEATDESTEITNTDINNNIVQIYQLLRDVSDGTLSLKVDMGDSSAWSQALKAERY